MKNKIVRTHKKIRKNMMRGGTQGEESSIDDNNNFNENDFIIYDSSIFFKNKEEEEQEKQRIKSQEKLASQLEELSQKEGLSAEGTGIQQSQNALKGIISARENGELRNTQLVKDNEQEKEQDVDEDKKQKSIFEENKRYRYFERTFQKNNKKYKQLRIMNPECKKDFETNIDLAKKLIDSKEDMDKVLKKSSFQDDVYINIFECFKFIYDRTEGNINTKMKAVKKSDVNDYLNYVSIKKLKHFTDDCIFNNETQSIPKS